MEKNRQILKFPLSMYNSFSLSKTSKFLHIGLENDKLYMWFIVDLDGEKIKRNFTLVKDYAILNDVKTDPIYLGSICYKNETFHLFETF